MTLTHPQYSHRHRSTAHRQSLAPSPIMSARAETRRSHRRSRPGATTAGLVMPLVCLIVGGPATAAGWSLVPHVGASLLADQSAASTAIGAEDPTLDIAVDTGFTAGLGLRYDYGTRWSSEIGWEYRSNDSDVTTAQGETLTGGNYASNLFYLNGRYDLVESESSWVPFVGAGVTYIEEIDIDVGEGNAERSFSDSGAFGFQLMTGVNRDLTERLYLSGELRYSQQSELDLNEESGDGRVSGLDYDPITVQLGIGVRF